MNTIPDKALGRELYFYEAKLVKVVDGDTLKLSVDLGFRITFVDNFRLIRINTPEIRGPERPQGLISKDYVINLFKQAEINGDKIYINSFKHGKYRWLADVWIGELNLNDHLIEAGMAEEYR